MLEKDFHHLMMNGESTNEKCEVCGLGTIFSISLKNNQPYPYWDIVSSSHEEPCSNEKCASNQKIADTLPPDDDYFHKISKGE